ncbi:hypothetical protein Ddye_012362 [Dipteronia dyeriana]|uniref:Reverse transcriptase zinc-binding domain-containing protein n=1 Tax=Dipteronia dyeriana TaxID=168575 RepID=A0AAD9X4C5_9ROSI|nr:hypothetical protein Ddye_012362 [Dipteronia dyeriana]
MLSVQLLSPARQLVGSSARRQDSLVWHFDKMGSFSVNSAYHLGCSVSVSSFASRSGLDSSESWWKYLWRMKLPAKVKVHIWKACMECLRVMTNLVKKGVAGGVCVSYLWL